MRISVLTPCFNAAPYIAAQLASVASQSFAGHENIIIDDGSTDRSAEVVAAAARTDPRVRLFRQSNRGVAAARNRAFQEADPRADYLLFLDADDCLEPDMLQVCVDYLDTHPDVGMVHTGHTCIDAEGRPLPLAAGGVGPTERRVPSMLSTQLLPPNHAETPFAALFALAWIVPSVVVFRRSVYERAGGWDERMGHIYEDADLFLRAALLAPVHYIPRPLVRYRRHGAQSTANADRVARQEQKLRDKWRRPHGLTTSQLAVVEEAWRFFDGRILPKSGAAAGMRHLALLQIGSAVRFLVGATHRYIRGFALGRRVPATNRPPKNP